MFDRCFDYHGKPASLVLQVEDTYLSLPSSVHSADIWLFVGAVRHIAPRWHPFQYSSMREQGDDCVQSCLCN